MTDRNTKIPGNQIQDNSITEVELNITNMPFNGQMLKVNMPSGTFTAIDIPITPDLSKLEDNIMLNAFRIAILGSLTQFNMVDGIVDEYEDESGIDNVNSINESYDSILDCYSPYKVQIDAPFTHYKCNDNTGDTVVTDDGVGENNGVSSINTSDLSVFGKINNAFEFVAENTEFINVNTLITDIKTDSTGSICFWIYLNTLSSNIIPFDINGTIPGTDWCRLRIASSGTIDFVIQNSSSSASHSILSNPVTSGVWYHIAIIQDGTPGAISIYINNIQQTITTNFVGSYDGSEWFTDISGANLGRIACSAQLGAGSESNRLDGIIDDFHYYQNKVLTEDEISVIYNEGNGTEESQPGLEPENLTLISESFSAEQEPDMSRIILLEEDIDEITLNTDLKVYASRDGGSSYVQGTLSEEGNFDASKRILVADFDFTQSGIGSGTDMQYKFITDNNKDLKIHATALNWD